MHFFFLGYQPHEEEDYDYYNYDYDEQVSVAALAAPKCQKYSGEISFLNSYQPEVDQTFKPHNVSLLGRVLYKSTQHCKLLVHLKTTSKFGY